MIKTGIDKLDYYTSGVASGEIDVCKWVRLSVDRHYSDLDRWGVKKKQGNPYYFEARAAAHYVGFFEEKLRHYDGVFAGQPFTFEPWQWFAFGSPFGWLRYQRINDKPVRRFRELDVFVPKKQGKSIWIAGTMLYMLEYDDYPGAQVYSLALNRSHAETLGYRDAEILVNSSPELKAKYRVNKGAATRGIYFDGMNSHVKPLVSKEEIADGPKIHVAANDEVKDWENFDLYNTLINGTASDPMAMVINISTAGDNKTSLGYERQAYVEQILDGRIEDDQTFGIVYGIDEGDEKEWDTERVWKKANPNYGITVSKEYYDNRVKAGRNNQHNKAIFLTKHLNMWVDSVSGWLNMDAWDKCGADIKIEDHESWQCIVSIDLASKIDLTVRLKLFFQDDRCVIFPSFYMPEEVLQDDKKYNEAMRSQLRRWADMGHITLTSGSTVDYDVIKEDVKQDFRDYDVVEMPYDPWNSTQFINSLDKDGIDIDLMTEYTQAGYKAWTEPMKETERMILEGRLIHDNNPVMRWCMGNVVIRLDNNDNIRPEKELPQNKIDGAIALFQAVAVGIIRMQEDTTPGDLMVV